MKSINGGNFHKEVFERISDDKREKIFESAMHEFAKEGYVAANINTIASKAGISIGAMYTYFPSKENLFLAIAERGVAIYQEILADLVGRAGFFETVERLFHLTIEYAKEHTDLSRLYLELSTEQLGNLSVRLSEKMEIDFREFYTELLAAAKEKGEIRSDVDIGFAAKMLDDLVISLQFSYSVSYYNERMQQYVGEDHSEAQMVQNLVDLVHRYLALETMPA